MQNSLFFLVSAVAIVSVLVLLTSEGVARLSGLGSLVRHQDGVPTHGHTSVYCLRLTYSNLLMRCMTLSLNN